MDMAVGDLFKHKIRLTFDSKVTEIYEPMAYRRIQYYDSPIIENVESVDASLFKPFALYALPKVIHEDRNIPIDYVEINVVINDLHDEDYELAFYQFEDPQASPELFFTQAEVDTRPFPSNLLNQPFRVNANVTCYYICSSRRQEVRFRRAFNYYAHWRYNLPIEDCSDEESSDNEKEDPPGLLIEAHRLERCVICLKSKPNILYLNCTHIVVCDSCDGRSNHCDVCQAKISKRIKI